jgi:hypothetical protein
MMIYPRILFEQSSKVSASPPQIPSTTFAKAKQLCGVIVYIEHFSRIQLFTTSSLRPYTTLKTSTKSYLASRSGQELGILAYCKVPCSK